MATTKWKPTRRIVATHGAIPAIHLTVTGLMVRAVVPLAAMFPNEPVYPQLFHTQLIERSGRFDRLVRRYPIGTLPPQPGRFGNLAPNVPTRCTGLQSPKHDVRDPPPS